jgi:hypothetical protein
MIFQTNISDKAVDTASGVRTPAGAARLGAAAYNQAFALVDAHGRRRAGYPSRADCAAVTHGMGSP